MAELKTLKDIEINDWLFQKAQGEKDQTQIIVATNKLHPEGDFIPLIKPIVQSYELRQEAIKHIKELQKYDVSPNLKILGRGSNFKRPRNKNIIVVNDKEFIFNNKDSIQVRDLLIEWIKDFFNITKEDLK